VLRGCGAAQELFGNRGFIVSSPDRRPRRPARAWISGWCGRRARHAACSAFVEAVTVATRARDTIALISTAGFVSRAENIGATQTYGGELIASGRIAKRVSLTASYTRLVAEQRAIDPNFDGKTLPRTPGHLLYARGEIAGRPLFERLATFRLDASGQSTSYLDKANFQRVPGRVLVGAGTRCEIGRGLAMSLAVENLANTRVVELPADRPIDSPTPTPLSDVAGFPLPGRTFYLALDWTH
jgi:outer membrane receptor protein involved in Fe transport